jgi:hypothetical protein
MRVRHRSRLAETLLLVSALASSATAQEPRGIVRGVVTDAVSGTPLEGVQATLAGHPPQLTGADGRITFADVVAGPQRLVVRRIGYRSTEVQILVGDDDTTRVSVALHRISFALDTVRIESRAPRAYSPRLEPFERHRTSNLGRFFTRADIQRRGPAAKVSDLLFGTPSVDVVTDYSGITRLKSQRGGRIDRFGNWRQCWMRFGVDGVVRPETDEIDLVSLEDIHGVEVFSGSATIPREYALTGEDMGCGVVMIWLRDR